MIKKIDALTRHEHHYLTPLDKCYYFGEYTSGTSYAHSPTNNLISNFKKPISVRGSSQWKYKGRAIKQVTSMISSVLFPDPTNSLIVPIPPSKVVTNPNYDDRMTQVLNGACPSLGIPFKELIRIRTDMNAFHESNESRPSPSELITNLELDMSCASFVKRIVYLIDDVITTGSHFKACKELIQNQFPNTIVEGLFIARRNFENPFVEEK